MTVAILDDETEILDALRRILGESGFDVSVYSRAQDFRAALPDSRWDAVLLDLGLAGESGLGVLRELRERAPRLDVAIISGTADVGQAVEALRSGAREFFEKPLRKAPIVAWLRRLQSERSRERERERLLSDTLARYEILGDSPGIREARDRVAAYADLDEPVLVYGETGTGKELAACLLHYRSRRRAEPLGAVNAAALSETLLDSQLFGHARGAFSGAVAESPGLIRASQGSSLFLDEIGELNGESQAKLLRVLQDGMVLGVGQLRPVKVDVRFICATNRDLETAIRGREFRQDLYYRVSSLSIRMPALREHLEDLPLLSAELVRRACDEHNLPLKEIEGAALDRLHNWSWPGNVRELRSVILRAVIAAGRASVVRADDLSLGAGGDATGARDAVDPFRETMALAAAKRRLERKYIQTQLDLHGGNVAETAAALGILPSNLYRKLREHGIAPPPS